MPLDSDEIRRDPAFYKARNERIIGMLELYLNRKESVELEIKNIGSQLNNAIRGMWLVTKNLWINDFMDAASNLSCTYVDIHRILMRLQELKPQIDTFGQLSIIQKALLQSPDTWEELTILNSSINLDQYDRYLEVLLQKDRGGVEKAVIDLLTRNN